MLAALLSPNANDSLSCLPNMLRPDQPRPPLRFGVFEVDFHEGELRKNGPRLRLPAQPFQVLAVLLERPGEVITREELRHRLWPSDTFVDFDHSLSTAINRIREVLSDSAENPRFVETRPRRGYRFVAPVANVDGTPVTRTASDILRQEIQGPEKRTAGFPRSRLLAFMSLVLVLSAGSYVIYRWSKNAQTRRLPEKIRLVVLPFNNLSGDSAQDYFSAGFTDELITQLARLNPERLGVIASTSSSMIHGKPISEIGRAFNVQYVIEGSVRRGGNEVRIDVQLIQASDETHIWANSYMRDLSDVLRVQSDVSESIARQIPANLHIAPMAPQPSVNPQAHDAYLKGQLYLNNRSSPDKSVELFEEATRLDPSYASAFASLAQAYVLLGEVPYSGMLPREAYAKSLAAARHALELNGALADAHASLGNSAFSFGWDLKTAEQEYRLALELDPNDASTHEWLGMVYMAQGKTREALEEGQRSLDLDPVSPACHAFIAQTYYFAGDYDKTADEARRILEVRPQFLNAQYWLGSAYTQKKMYPEAIEQFRMGRQLSGDAPVMVMAYGYAQAMSGDRAAALATLRGLEDQSRRHYVSPIYFVGIYLGLGDKKNALKFLNQAFEERNDRMMYMNVEPMVNPLRSDPAFQDLLRRVNAPARE
jgi:TolB-like protein/DNA-binding winged helix-turn-helix (wHTH) protein/Flp pilus assembly protein TadD